MILDPIFNKYKTVFTILDTLEIIKPGSGTKKVVVYVNLEFILKLILTSEVNNKLLASHDSNLVKTSLVSNIINFAQHYRWYFCKKGYDCHVYIYWNYQEGVYKNSKYNKNYRDYYNNKLYNSTSCKYIDDCLSSSYKTLRLIISHLNQVDLIDSSDIESSVIPYVLYENLYFNEPNTSHIIVSNDKYDLQYVRYGFRILIPKQDKTTIISDENALQILKDNYGVKSDIEVPIDYISFIISMLGCKYRNINKLAGVGMTTLLRILKTARDNLLIGNRSTDIDTLSSIVKEEYREKFIENYQCTDIQRQYNELTSLDIHKILSQKEDRYDDNAIEYLNDRYFQMCPIFNMKNHKRQIFDEESQNTGKSIFDR